MQKYIIGLDEVGRGSLAGPVVVVAVRIPGEFRLPPSIKKQLGTLHDSKKLTALQREAWSKYLTTQPQLRFAVGRVYPRTIERINISNAANRAALQAFKRLKVPAKNVQAIYLDGGLYLGDAQTSRALRAHTIIKGDEKIPVVAMASIIAKVNRDRSLCRLAKKHPAYGFEEHKGYGTRRHLRALRRHGVLTSHRLTFLKKSLIVS